MDEQELERVVEETAALRFSGTDEHRTVTVTVDGTGSVVGVQVLADETWRLRARIFESGLIQAFARARDAAAAAERPAVSALRGDGIEDDVIREVLP